MKLEYLWLVLFTLLVMGVFEQASCRVVRATRKLEAKASATREAIANAEERHETLELERASQSDPAYIELCLIRGLGLVPEGYTKIYFDDSEEKKRDP
jgi:hypothetical protein